jgi:stage II sporulation protein D
MPGGHALEVIVRVENSPREYRFHANDGFRRRIDPRAIRSTLFESIEVKGEKLVLAGRGWGHAVGMCQIGAYKLAAQGRTATEILEFYYPQSAVTKTY